MPHRATLAAVGTVSSFRPIAAADARVLILGSMPGVRSLRERQYYAHPQNAFWSILGAVCGFSPSLAYRERTRLLVEHGIALWDVLHSCERPGSLDSSIVAASRRANDFASFFRRHPDIAVVLCNGGTAFSLYGRTVVPALPGPFAELPCVRMPSTSPAHAGLRPPQKLAAWREVLAPVLPARSRDRRRAGRADGTH
ncbi:MAG TPA: DNA-deoxyinosine glycosylase [Planctomycetota bacterium]|nr:DNA-deoxyinosine glycosylase [Planctomycetota bacterium]